MWIWVSSGRGGRGRQVAHDLFDVRRVRAWVPLTAIAADTVALVAFTIVKGGQDWLIVAIAVGGIVGIFVFEALYLRVRGPVEHDQSGDQP